MTTGTAAIRIKNRVVASNTYVYPIDPERCLLIDPGLDQDAIEAVLQEHHLTPSAIYCTHGHFDHLGSAEYFRARHGIPIYLDPDDMKLARSSNFMMMALKLSSRVVVPKVFESIHETSKAIGDGGVVIDRAPGHTSGSVVIRVGTSAFTGDTLYRDQTWTMKWPEEDLGRLKASLSKIWETLPDDTLVAPGHGGSATFGVIKTINGPLRRLLDVREAVT